MDTYEVRFGITFSGCTKINEPEDDPKYWCATATGARLLACGPSGLLDFVLHALRALRPRDPRRCVHDGVHNACIRDSGC